MNPRGSAVENSKTIITSTFSESPNMKPIMKARTPTSNSARLKTIANQTGRRVMKFLIIEISFPQVTGPPFEHRTSA
jgi:hypothetical protein